MSNSDDYPLRRKNNSPAAAASATYRTAVKGIARALRTEPKHSKYPSLDLEIALAKIPKEVKKKALEWYIRGIKRGMAKATDLMAEGKIYLKGETVHAPKKIVVNVKMKISGGPWTSRKVSVRSIEIGFH